MSPFYRFIVMILVVLPAVVSGVETAPDRSTRGVLYYINLHKKGEYVLSAVNLEKQSVDVLGRFSADGYLYSAAASRDGEYVFYAVPDKTCGAIIGVMERNETDGTFETKIETPINIDKYQFINIIYDDWEGKIYVNGGFALPLPERDLVWDFPGYIDLGFEVMSIDIHSRKPALVNTGLDYGQIIALSEKYIYTYRKGISNEYYISRINKDGLVVEDLIEFPKTWGYVIPVILDGDGSCFVSAGVLGEKAPKNYLIDFALAGLAEIPTEPFVDIPESLEIIPIQNPYSPGVVFETDFNISIEKALTQDISYLDIENNKLVEIIKLPRTGEYRTCRGTAIWLRNEDIAAGFSDDAGFVNNANVSLSGVRRILPGVE
jgi:hypothetical protein